VATGNLVRQRKWIIGALVGAIVVTTVFGLFASGIVGVSRPDPLLVDFHQGVSKAQELSVLQSCRHFPTVISVEINPRNGNAQIDTRDAPFSPNVQPVRACLARSPLVVASGWGV